MVEANERLGLYYLQDGLTYVSVDARLSDLQYECTKSFNRQLSIMKKNLHSS